MPAYQKIVQMINFFAKKNELEQISKIIVLKLIFFADRYHMRKYGSMISNDEYWAMTYGPVPSTAKTITELSVSDPDIMEYVKTFLRKGKKFIVKSIAPVDNDQFSKSEIEAMEYAFSLFMSVGNIVELTHTLPEWKKHEKFLVSIHSRRKMDPCDFFSHIKGDDYSGNIPADHLNMAEEIFRENKLIQSWLA